MIKCRQHSAGMPHIKALHEELCGHLKLKASSQTGLQLDQMTLVCCCGCLPMRSRAKE